MFNFKSWVCTHDYSILRSSNEGYTNQKFWKECSKCGTTTPDTTPITTLTTCNSCGEKGHLAIDFCGDIECYSCLSYEMKETYDPNNR